MSPAASATEPTTAPKGISRAQLRTLFLGLPAPSIDAFAGPLNAALVEHGITHPSAIAAWVAQVGHESQGLMRWTESFAYSAERLVAVFGRARFPSVEAAQLVVNQGPRGIAEKLYGGRMGNKRPGDGLLYRGRGPHGLTGHDNYARHGERLGLPLLANPDLLGDKTTPAPGFRSAALFGWEIGVANGTFETVEEFLLLSRHWNGGPGFHGTPNGWDDRRARWGAARVVLGLPAAREA